MSNKPQVLFSEMINEVSETTYAVWLCLFPVKLGIFLSFHWVFMTHIKQLERPVFQYALSNTQSKTASASNTGDHQDLACKHFQIQISTDFQIKLVIKLRDKWSSDSLTWQMSTKLWIFKSLFISTIGMELAQCLFLPLNLACWMLPQRRPVFEQIFQKLFQNHGISNLSVTYGQHLFYFNFTSALTNLLMAHRFFF